MRQRSRRRHVSAEPRRPQSRSLSARAASSASCLRVVLAAGRAPLAAQHAGPPNWPQFRGNARLTGVATAAPPATLSLQVDLRGRRGDRLVGRRSPTASSTSARPTATCWRSISHRQAALEVRDRRASIGESSPAVGAGAVFVGDLAGIVHAVNVARRQAGCGRSRPTSEIKSSPAWSDDLVLIGSYDTHLYALERRTGKVRWKLQTDGQVHATPAVHERRRLHRAAATSSFRARPRRRRQGAVRDAARRLHRRVAGDRRRPRLRRHVQQRGARARPASAQDRRGATAIPTASSRSTRRRRSSDGRVIVGGRDKAVHAIDAATGKSAGSS